ncbi:cob(I)yrinic acid a,c-diamide adenosyltransferase [Anaeroselena agilis]|uniref:Corrinoid adenosyltransferase n=1 Tax=Anaeroselena agilis TaxID=3063788 RepID=A0ABU3NTZ3_9FIRM|nr:cob(I)yrinic acid a,c-diamide adenosyltransferase [Selenomonadales bacterium 4137-cl]
MKVYTRTGDKGETSLFSRQRVTKDNIRVEAYGTVDEANAAIGLARALLGNRPWAERLQAIQRQLVGVNADLATAGEPMRGAWLTTDRDVAALEGLIDELERVRIPQPHFVTPGDCPAGAALDLARTMVRRAERCVVRLRKAEAIAETTLVYLNRLSDLLFVMARCVEQEELIALITRRVQSILGGDSMTARDSILEKAKRAIDAAESKAAEIGVPMVIAIVDQGGNLVAQHRMDGALLASISIALDKAYTATALKMTTEQAAALAQPGQMLYGINTTDGGRMVVFGGGLPIVADGVVVGGLGVSGGSVEDDIRVANAGLAAWR